MREMRNIAQEMISLNQTQSDDHSMSVWKTRLTDETYSPEEQAILSCMSKDVAIALDILSVKKKRIFSQSVSA